MIERIVRGNRVYLRTSDCELRICRFTDTKILLILIGNDTGKLGRIPFDELSQGLSSSGKLELFIDTSGAKGVSIAVSDQWERWFATHRSQVKAVHLFAPQKFFLIMAGMIKEFSRLGDLFHVYSDKVAFEHALGEPIIEEGELPVSKPPVVQQQIFKGSRSASQIIHVRPGVLFMKITGQDTGETIREIMSSLSNEIHGFPGPWQLFVDASETRGISAEVRDAWTHWITENRTKLLSIDVLTQSRIVSLFVSAAKIFSRTGDLMNVLENRTDFLQKLESAAPGIEAIILGTTDEHR